MHLPQPIRSYRDLRQAKAHLAGERQALETYIKQERRQITRDLGRNWLITETGVVVLSQLAQWGIRLTRKSKARHATAERTTSDWLLLGMEIAQEIVPVLLRKWQQPREQ